MPRIDDNEIQKMLNQAEADSYRTEFPDAAPELTADELVKRALNSNYDN
jgi:hypothetical protein